MIIKNGTIINPETKETFKADLLIQDGTIRAIDATCSLTATDDEIIDAEGLIVSPGLIDTHVHFRDPGFTYKEDIHTGALASAKGGFTSVICMANTSPTIDSLPILKDVLERAAKEDIHIYQAASVSYGLKGEKLTDMEALKEAGACGFTDDGIPLLDAKFCYEAMEKAAKLDVPISLHEEDPAFITNNGINRGEISEKLGIGGSPAIAEEVLTARDCMMALHTGADLVIQHISSGNSVALVRNAKAMGAHVHAESTPHHFTLNHEAVLKYGTLAKMNPPLRSKADNAALIEGIKDGTIDCIVTDHAPHADHEKAREFELAPFGMTGLETSLGVILTYLVDPGLITYNELVELMAIKPREILRLDQVTLKQGSVADITIFDPEVTWTVQSDDMYSKSHNSGFLGYTLKGRATDVFVGGTVTCKDGVVVE
mgnify:CR=1 FL=1